MPTLQEQIATAKAAGYSDADIAQHLSSRADLAPKIKQATEAGYQPEQIVAHLASSPAATPAAKTSLGQDIAQGVGNLVGGLTRGAGSIGATLLAPLDAAARAVNDGKPVRIGDFELAGHDRRAGMDGGLSAMGAEPDSLVFKGGKLGGEIAGTAGAGGVIANTVGRAGPALAATSTGGKLLTSIASGGFKTGAAPATNLLSRAAAANMGTRVAGGALAGGAGAGLVDPNNAGVGAVIGGALPPVLAGGAKVGSYAGNALYSLVQPFTAGGQERLAGSIINRFARGGPTALNNAELVPGSVPTLAESTGNAGVAGLQRNVSELSPNMFAERQASNAAARTAALDDVAGDAGKLDFFRGERSSAGGALYEDALAADTSANLTPFIKGQISQLLKRPSINEARKTAQRWAIERGEKPSFDGNMRGLHDMKTAIDDQISEAVRAGKGGEAKALSATQAKLLDVMEKLSPAYKEARATYAEMSKPINQMEVLQGLRLTDAKGNITLSKVQTAMDSLERKMTGPGNDAAKSLTDAQIGTLRAIRDDLLRQSNLSAGKAAGSNTLQNIATDNMISAMLPGRLGEIVGNKAGGVAGQLGRLMYSGPNEAVRNRLVDLMLDPAAAKQAMDASGRPILDASRANALSNLVNKSAPIAYRTAPVLSNYR